MFKKCCISLSVWAFLIFGALWATGSIASTSGNIHFDPDNDSTNEHTFNSNGKFGVNDTAPSSALSVSGCAYIESGSIGIHQTQPTSSLHLGSGMSLSVQTVSAAADLTGNTFVIADTSASGFTLTLPYAGNVTGRIYKIKKSSTENTLTINGGGNLIDSVANVNLTTSGNGLPMLEVVSNGQQWLILAKGDYSSL